METDLVVIGAGIHGAGAAQAASAAGYRVLLIEQYSRAARGTSSRSSKLIHGGLRYLESGQFSLVKECLDERTRLLRNAPELVRLVPFYIPVYRHSRRPAWKIAAGLTLYSLMSLRGFKRVARKHWRKLDGIKQQGLKTVFQYYDAQTDDTLLTRAVLASAASLGTRIWFEHSFVTADIYADHCMVLCQHAGGEEKHIRCSAIVNAAGPWARQIADSVPDIGLQPEVELVQGTHIEVPGLLARGIYYLEAPQDMRAVFVMPWKNHTLIGTTETPYQGDPADVVPLDSEINYLLDVFNHYFTDRLKRGDVLNAFAGLRVLPNNEGSAFDRPRDTLITGNSTENARFWSLYGGKLTAYRATAEALLNKLSTVLPPASGQRRDTRKLRLRADSHP